MKRNKVVIFVLLLMVLLLACSTIGLGGNENPDGQSQGNSENGSNQGTEQNGDDTSESSEDDADPSSSEDLGKGLGETDFGKLLASGSLSIEDINSNADGETVGEILTVHFINQSDDEIQVAIPCGLVFLPVDPGEQPLMLVQPLDVTLSPGEEANLQPFVVCADLKTSAPSLGSGYTIGYIEDENLLAFAQCICNQEINTELGSLDSLGVQFATWTVSIGGDASSLVEETEGSVLEEMMEGMEVDEFIEYFTELLNTFGGEWLDRCSINFEE